MQFRQAKMAIFDHFQASANDWLGSADHRLGLAEGWRRPVEHPLALAGSWRGPAGLRWSPRDRPGTPPGGQGKAGKGWAGRDGDRAA
jgi:hypothetical protein